MLVMPHAGDSPLCSKAYRRSDLCGDRAHAAGCNRAANPPSPMARVAQVKVNLGGFDYTELWIAGDEVYTDEEMLTQNDVIFDSAVFYFEFDTGHNMYPYLVILQVIKFDGTYEQNEVDRQYMYDLVNEQELEEEYGWISTQVRADALPTVSVLCFAPNCRLERPPLPNTTFSCETLLRWTQSLRGALEKHHVKKYLMQHTKFGHQIRPKLAVPGRK